MTRQFKEKEILIGSQNPGKVKEFKQLFDQQDIKIRSPQDFQLAEPDETGSTFFENALLKARYYVKMSKLPTLVDDSGIKIVALGNGPGIHTKQFFEKLGGQKESLNKLEALMAGKDPSATMHCVLILMWPDGHYESCEGIVKGTITLPPRGEGFGFDPVFIPQGYGQTFGEDQQLKIQVSHRARALKMLYELCFQ